jgi:hypothetical protein
MGLIKIISIKKSLHELKETKEEIERREVAEIRKLANEFYKEECSVYNDDDDDEPYFGDDGDDDDNWEENEKRREEEWKKTRPNYHDSSHPNYIDDESKHPDYTGQCQDITKHVEKYFKDAGYNAERTAGYYIGAGDDYYPDMDEWDEWDINKFERDVERKGIDRIKFTHWWVEIDNKYIVDITESQFHPNEQKHFRDFVHLKRLSKNTYKAR